MLINTQKFGYTLTPEVRMLYGAGHQAGGTNSSKPKGREQSWQIQDKTQRLGHFKHRIEETRYLIFMFYKLNTSAGKKVYSNEL